MKQNHFHKNPFTTPPTYFGELKDNILHKTVEQKQTKKTYFLPVKTWVWASVAATLALLVWFGNPFSDPKKITPQEISQANETVYELFIEEDEKFSDLGDVSQYDEYVYLVDE